MNGQYKARSDHFMKQLHKDIVRLVGFLGISDHLNISTFRRLTKQLRELRSYSRISDEEMFHLLERTDKQKWTYWTIHIIIKGGSKWIYID